MKLFKGFDKDLKCRGHQFEVGATYEENEAKLCAAGFHACENPLDVLDYYPLLNDDAQLNRFAEVDLDATDERHGDDSKRVGKKIYIKTELSLKDFVKAGIEFLLEDNTAKGIKGDEKVKAASGDWSRLAASGDGSQLAASGDGSRLAASGNGSQLAASGYRSQLAASGENSVVAAIGIESKAKASKGSWITLAEWVHDGNKYLPKSVVTKQVDGEEVKADTWYVLKDGAFLEDE